MSRFPRFHISEEDGAIVSVANTVQQVCLDLVCPLLDAKARRGSKKLEQVVTQIRWINSEAHNLSR